MEFDPYNRTELTGPWAGFAFLGNRLIAPEGRELLSEDLAWLSFTACQAREWRRMMDMARPDRVQALAKAIRVRPAEVVDLAEVIKDRTKRSARVMTGPSAEPPMAADTKTGPSVRR